MLEILLPIREKILEYYRTKWKARALEGVARFIIISSVTFLLVTLFELFFHGSSSVRAVLFFVWLLLSAASLVALALFPGSKCLKSIHGDEIIQLSGEIGSHYPDVRDNLANVLELSAQAEAAGTSHPFTELALWDVSEKTAGFDFKALIQFDRMKRLLSVAFISGVLSLLLITLIPGLRLSAGRVILFSHSFQPPPRFYVSIVPGDIKLTRGTDLFGKTIVYGGKAQKVWLFTKLKEESSFQKRELEPDSTGEYPFQFRALHSDLEYYAVAEDVESSRYTAHVVDRPIIKELHVQVMPPGYSRLPILDQVDNGSFSCLYGSKVTFSVESSAELQGAEIVFNDSLHCPMNISGTHSSAEVTPKIDASYKIYIKDRDGNLNEAPVTYAIKLFYDAPPGIELLLPRGDTYLENSQRNSVSVRIADDYGFSSLNLYYRLSKSEFEKPQEKYTAIAIPIEKGKNEQTVSYIFRATESKDCRIDSSTALSERDCKTDGIRAKQS
jgi:hypothetical protein